MKRCVLLAALLGSLVWACVARAEIMWEAPLLATPTEQVWRSPMKFGHKAALEVGIYVGKFPLPGRERGKCTIFYDGAGVHAKLTGCPNPKHPFRPIPLKVKYRTWGVRTVPLTVIYGV